MPDDDPIQRGQEALGHLVSDFANPADGWVLVAQCSGQCRLQQRRVADFGRHLRPGTTWAELLPRLRCARCGQPAALVGLGGPPIASKGSRQAWAMLLPGPGPWRP